MTPGKRGVGPPEEERGGATPSAAPRQRQLPGPHHEPESRFHPRGSATARWDLKDAVSKVLPEAKRLAGVRVAVRTLFYKVRPLIQRFTGDVELDYKYFSQRLLPEYQRRDGLARHGAAAKLVPPDDVLNSYAQQAGEDALTYLVTDEIERRIDVPAIVAQLLAEYPELGEVTTVTVRERLADRPVLSWRAAADAIIDADINGDVTERTRELIIARFQRVTGVTEDGE